MARRSAFARIADYEEAEVAISRSALRNAAPREPDDGRHGYHLRSKERRITRWEHEHLLETVQQRLDQDPQAMRRRRETVEHPFGTLKMRMGATHFLMKTLPKVASEMALSVLAYNLTRVMNIVGTRALLAAIRA